MKHLTAKVQQAQVYNISRQSKFKSVKSLWDIKYTQF